VTTLPLADTTIRRLEREIGEQGRRARGIEFHIHPNGEVTMSDSNFDAYTIAFKYNNCCTWTRCAVCGQVDRPDVGPMSVVEGTWNWVCYTCLEKCLPGGQAALNALLDAYVVRADREIELMELKASSKPRRVRAKRRTQKAQPGAAAP
jgi:hypothetical protein